MELEITPQPFYIGGVNVGQSVVVAWFVTALLIILAIILAVDSIRTMAKQKKLA